MKKSFNIGDKGKQSKVVYQGSPLDLILGDENELEPSKNKKLRSEAQKRTIEKKPKPVIDKTKKDEASSTTKKGVKNSSLDKRKVEDKKKPFSTVVKGSLQKEIQEVLIQYRQKINFEYNKAQFIEDAIVRQLKYIKGKLKENDR